MKIEVTRHSFYQEPHKQTVRFTEHVPAKPAEADHALCNCTVTSRVRPPGIPAQVTDTVDLSVVIPGQTGDVVYRLTCSKHSRPTESPPNAVARRKMNDEYGTTDGLSVGFWVTWPREAQKPLRKWDAGGEHAYFWFNAAADNLQIEITGTGDGLSLSTVDPLDCLLTHLYFGDKVDTRRLYNGHSRPGIGNPGVATRVAAVKPDELWIYASAGSEDMEVLPQSREVTAWRAFRVVCNNIKSVLAVALAAKAPEAIHAALLLHKGYLDAAMAHCVTRLESIRSRPAESVMVQAARRVNENVYQLQRVQQGQK